MAYIYKITDTRNGALYIGKHSEKDSNRKYFSSGLRVNRVRRKHGKKVLKKEILIQGDFNDALLNELEKHYIQLYNTFYNQNHYNLTPGGDGVTEYSQESKDKQIQSLKRYYKENDVWNKGKKMDYDPWNKGKKWTDEEKENAKFGNVNINRVIPILQFDYEGNLIKEWKSAQEFDRVNNTNSKSLIRQVCKGEFITAHYSTFLNKEDYEKNPSILNERIEKIKASKFEKREVLQYSLDGELINTYSCYTEIDGSSVLAYFRGTNKTYKNTILIFKDQFSEELLNEKLEAANKPIERIGKRKPVVQIDLRTNKIIKVWRGASFAEKELGCNNIARCCKGKRGGRSVLGFKWKYLSDVSQSELDSGYATQ